MALLASFQSSQSTTATNTSSQTSTDPLQALFNQIDTAGTGSITKAQLEQAVTSAGGTTQAADALWAKLDPNNTGSVTEQQFAQNMPVHGHHHHRDNAADNGNTAQDAMNALLQSMETSQTGSTAAAAAQNTTNPGAQFAQNLFNQIDATGTGSITKPQLEQAVTNAGGTTQAADALWANLDPNNTGSVTEQQFAQGLAPPAQNLGSTNPKQLFQQADTNGDGSISQNEFIAVIQQYLAQAMNTQAASSTQSQAISLLA